MSRCIGIDITPDAIRAVEVSRTRGNLCLLRTYAKERGQSENADGDTVNDLLLANMTREAGFRAGVSVVAGLPCDKVFFSTLRTDLARHEDVRRLLKFELEDDFPVTFDELVLDICGHRNVGDDEREYVIAATSREQIRIWMQTFQQAGMKSSVFATDVCGLYSVLALARSSGDNRPFAALHAEKGRVIVVVAQDGNIVAARHIGCWSPEDLTATALVRDLELTIRGVFRGLTPRPRQILLSGPDQVTGDLVEELSKTTDYEISLVDIEPVVDVSEPGTWDRRFAIALGLALLGLNGGRPGLNFLHADTSQADRMETSKAKRTALVSVFLVIVLVALFGARMYAMLNSLETENARVDSDIRMLYARTFPEEKKIVNELAQMTEHLNIMRKEHDILAVAAGPRVHPLRVLNALGEKLASEKTIVVSSFSIGDNGIRVTGTGSSFESVEQFLEKLREVPEFDSVVLEDVALARGSNRPEFRLQISVKAG